MGRRQHGLRLCAGSAGRAEMRCSAGGAAEEGELEAEACREHMDQEFSSTFLPNGS